MNPADMPLPWGSTLIVVATSKKLLHRALKKPFNRLPAAEVERLTYLPQARRRCRGKTVLDGWMHTAVWGAEAKLDGCPPAVWGAGRWMGTAELPLLCELLE